VAAFPPLGLYLLVVVLFLNTQQLQVAIVARQIVARYAGIVGWIAFVWFLWRLIDMIFDLWSARMARTERRRAMSALSFVRRSAKVILVMIAFVAVLNTFGINAMTGIAALGLSGLAFALGAQKTIENLVGSLAVIIDQPVRVGDFCKVGDVLGTVEDIGMRSTQLRTNERTVVTIPNSNFSSKEIENYSRRDRFLFNSTIGLTYDTSAQKMRVVLDAILKLLIDDKNVINDARVRFIAFNSSSLDIEIFAYIRTYQLEVFLAIREELLLKIMDIVADEGASMAFPTRTIVIQREDEI
jgi:MscS family membrane protein